MDYSKVCWYCGLTTMVNRGDCFQCSSCNATWNAVREPGDFALGPHEVIRGPKGKKVVSGGTPSKATLEKAVRIREHA